MTRRNGVALVSVAALLVVTLTRPATRSLVVDGLVGMSEMIHPIRDDSYSFFRPHFVLWQLLDPTCPEYL